MRECRQCGVRLKRVWPDSYWCYRWTPIRFVADGVDPHQRWSCWPQGCYPEMKAVGSIETLQDLRGSHDRPQVKKDGYSWTRQGGRVFSMMSVFSWRSFQDRGDDSTPPYHRTCIPYWVIIFIATLRAVSVLDGASRRPIRN